MRISNTFRTTSLITILICLLVIFLGGISYCQEVPLEKQKWIVDAIQAWKSLENSGSPMRVETSYDVESSNERSLPSGRHHWVTAGENTAWYCGDSPKEAFRVVVDADKYRFILSRDDDGSLKRVNFQNERRSARRPNAGIIFRSFDLGARERFSITPVLKLRQSEIPTLLKFARDTKVNRNANGKSVVSFDIDSDALASSCEKLRKANENVEASKHIMMAGQMGLCRGILRIDNTTNLLEGWTAEFERERPPLTLVTIRAINASGQRRPDGSMIPENLAEPPGKQIKEKSGVQVSWTYSTANDCNIVDSYVCSAIGDKILMAAPSAFKITNIKFDKPKDKKSFYLGFFGMPEPQDD